MEEYADGEAQAFERVYAELAPRLYRFLRRLGCDPDTAADLLQQAFLRMHEARCRFSRGAPVEPWAYAITRRLFIDSRRRNRNAASDLDEHSVANASDTEGMARAGELSRALSAELGHLPPQQREAFMLIRYEQLSMAEAAEVLGATEAAVKLRAHRAAVYLRERLGEFLAEKEPG